MEESEWLAYDNPCSGSNATVMGADSPSGPQLSLHDRSADSPPNTLRDSAPHLLGSPMEQMLLLVPAVTAVDTVQVHVPQADLDDL